MKNKLRLVMLLLVMSSSSAFADFPTGYGTPPESFDDDVPDTPPAEPAAPIDDYVLPMLVLGIAFGAVTFAKARKTQNA